MKLNNILVSVLTLFLSVSVLAQSAPVQEPMIFENQQQEDRFNQLTQELRCLVCQNQNLADSDAQLAHDLRAEVHEMLLAGKTDDEIKTFMVERYGDFVLYRPPVQVNTYLLWLAPLVLLLIGALILRVNIKKRTTLLESTPDEASENRTE
ncbi:MAG: cytochrome c-type biogenesis protein [Lysobacterales bacterium]|jgi:cytochrome c-type biogenesis protein CcmH